MHSVSQSQIAEDLGISQSLVSLVLNGRRKGIARESYERIWEHALRLGYKPKGMAAIFDPLEVGKKLNVGFVLRAGLTLDTQSNFFSHIQHGLHAALEDSGINTVFLGCEKNSNDADFSKAMPSINTLMGLVVMGEVQPEYLQSLLQFHPCIVTVAASYPGQCHSVISNEERSLELLVRHLVDLGHTRFAWLGGDTILSRHTIRLSGMRKALRLFNLSLDEQSTIQLDKSERRNGSEAAKRLLSMQGREDFPTAWICYNGLMARGAISYLQQQQISIPGDISIVAVDATRVCEEDEPLITGAGADPEKMGRKAGELIIKSTGLENALFTDVIVASQLTVRTSSGPAPSDQ